MSKYATASLAAVMAILFLVGAAFAASDTASTSASVTVNEFLSVTLSNAPVAFPNLDPGTGPTAANVSNGYPLTATIGSESNVDADVSTKADASDFTGPGTLAVSNMEWSDASAGTYADYTTSDATVCSSIGASVECDIYHQITIPGGQAAGSYSVGLTVTATSV